MNSLSIIFIIFYHSIFPIFIDSAVVPPLSDEHTSQYWLTDGQDQVLNQLFKMRNEYAAKNVIFFLGDGMSVPTITAARIYSGQQKGQRGEESQLSFDKFPYVGLSRTYCVDSQVADSACSATAYLGGVKGNIQTIGVNAQVKLNDCAASLNKMKQVNSIAYYAQKKGKATGIVTNTRVTHASPAGAYAHTSNRDFESDADIERLAPNVTNCRDIASQLILDEPGRDFDVILGGGWVKFLPKNYSENNLSGERLDGANLIDLWKKRHPRGAFITNRNELLNLKSRTDQVLGLFAPSHMSYNLDADRKKEPTLKEMTKTAITLLSKERKGYFLFIEGGLIDLGHHANQARKAFDETVQFSEAIQTAVDITNQKDTLIIVTADHAHCMTMSGYPKRGNDILGVGTDISDIDGLPYTTISYANGPGAINNNGVRSDPRTVMYDANSTYPALVPLIDETHGGDDVGIFAIGPQAHLFTGVIQQHVIAHLLSYAGCFGNGITACNFFV